MPEPEDIDDRQLLLAWQRGDNAAGDVLLRRHFDALYRFFNGKIDDVTDLIQHTMLACVESRNTLPADVPFRAYLLGIARNKLLMHLRGAGRRARREQVEPQSVAQAQLPGISHAVALREEQRTLLLALRRLPLEAQLAIELLYWEELTVANIANIFEVPEGTMKTRLFKARRRLEQEIAAIAGSPAVADVTVRQLATWAASLRRHVEPE